MSKNLPNGIGESLGDTLVVNSPLFISGAIWHVDSTNTDALDSAGYGVLKEKPLATLAYAITQATAGDTIVLHDGHTESLALSGDTVDVSKRLIVVGAGQSGGEPTVELNAASGSGTALVALTAAGSELRNIKFTAYAVDDAADQVDIQASDCRIIGCVFEANGNHGGKCVDIGSGFTTLIRSTIFRSTSTDPADQPVQGLEWTGGLLWLESVEFDNGTVGWSTAAAAPTSAAVQVVAENVTMKGARVQLYETGSQYHWSAPTQTGNAQIQEV